MALAAVFAAVLTVTLTHIASSPQRSCAVAAPIPSLPSRLRSLGGFDQPQDPSDVMALAALAEQAGASVAPGLIGTQPQRPVPVAAATAGQPDALVVPLLSAPQPAARQVVSGLVAFLLDCSGRAYFSAVDDLTASGTSAPSSFPSVSPGRAAATLGTTQPELVYGDSPFAPRWRDPSSGASLAAFAA